MPVTTIDLVDLGFSALSVGIAGFALYIAFTRLQETAKQARARVLVDILRTWESDYLDEARDIYYALVDRFRADYIEKEGADLSDPDAYEAFVKACQDWFEPQIEDLKHENRQRFVTVLRVFDFFEKIGVLNDQKYVAEEDVLRLFGYHLRQFDAFAGGYLKRQKVLEVEQFPSFADEGLYSAYESLAKRAQTPKRDAFDWAFRLSKRSPANSRP